MRIKMRDGVPVMRVLHLISGPKEISEPNSIDTDKECLPEPEEEDDSVIE